MLLLRIYQIFIMINITHSFGYLRSMERLHVGIGRMLEIWAARDELNFPSTRTRLKTF